MSKRNVYFKGVKDGMPVGLGYLSVSFAFGMLAMECGLPAWSAILTSAASVTGTGQFVGVDMLSKGMAFTQIAITVLIINLRYVLMSLSWSQRLDPKIGVGTRMLLAFGNTDEVFAISMAQKGYLTAPYLFGVMTLPLIGWTLGTALGCLASGILPLAVRSALGIAIYAMFLGIIIPPARDSKAVAQVIVIAAVMSLILRYVPGLNQIGSGWATIICGIAAAAYGAWKQPAVTEEEDEDDDR